MTTVRYGTDSVWFRVMLSWFAFGGRGRKAMKKKTRPVVSWWRETGSASSSSSSLTITATTFFRMAIEIGRGQLGRQDRTGQDRTGQEPRGRYYNLTDQMHILHMGLTFGWNRRSTPTTCVGISVRALREAGWIFETISAKIPHSLPLFSPYFLFFFFLLPSHR